MLPSYPAAEGKTIPTSLHFIQSKWEKSQISSPKYKHDEDNYTFTKGLTSSRRVQKSENQDQNVGMNTRCHMEKVCAHKSMFIYMSRVVKEGKGGRQRDALNMGCLQAPNYVINIYKHI